jgi:hypothetical protein
MSTRKSQTKDFEYVKGFNTNLSNDAVPTDQWRYITDAREPEVGKWKTRQGNDYLSIPIGEAVNVQETSTTGASTFEFNAQNRFAAKLTAASTARLTSLEARIRNANGATGTIVLALYSDSGGSPGTELMRTTIASSAVTSSFAYVKGRSVSCVDIANATAYWIVGFVQDGGSGSYEVSTTTNSVTGKTSADSGSTWSAAAANYNTKLSTATSGGVKGHIRIKRPDGTTVLFMAHGSSLYTVNESTGVTTAIDTGLDASTVRVRFAYVNDVLYYVTGLQKPRKYNFTTATEVTTAPEFASDIIEHKGIVFYRSAVDPTKVFYTNFAAYDTFTSTDFFYVPAPKTADPVNALAKLNGNLYLINRNNKHVLFGAENATFRLDEAVGRRGTFTPQSIAYNQSFIFLASDDGIYQFNGAEEKNISEDVLNWWSELLDKDNTILELWNNRLYVFYTPNGQAQNSRCRVYNTLYGVWESEDLNTWIGTTSSLFDQDDYFIQGSNRVGMVMYAERTTNDHCSMGEPFTWELRTSYQHYDAPAQFKRAPAFRPHLDTISGTYSVSIGYATDYSESPSYTQLALQGSGVTFGSGVTWNSGAVFAGAQQVNPLDTSLTIPGEWRRLQIRYRHYAAREPVVMDGHVLTIETQRLI